MQRSAVSVHETKDVVTAEGHELDLHEQPGPSNQGNHQNQLQSTILTHWCEPYFNRLVHANNCQAMINILDLSQVLIQLSIEFIIALQENSLQEWSHLHAVLCTVQPVLALLSRKKQIHHYVLRVLHFLKRHSEETSDPEQRSSYLAIQRMLNKSFPEVVKLYEEGGCKVYVCPRSDLDLSSPDVALPEEEMRRAFTGYHCGITGYQLPKKGQQYYLENEFKSRSMRHDRETASQITWDNVRQTIPKVMFDVHRYEAPHLHMAHSVDLTQADKVESPASTRCNTPWLEREQLSRPATVKTTKSAKKPQGMAGLTGEDAIGFFLKERHFGRLEFMYFNTVPNIRYEPYNVIAVPRWAAAPIHWVFSSWGVLHVTPDWQNEILTLAQWQHDAMLFRIISRIPFFFYFLLRKYFHLWYLDTCRGRFQKRRTELEGRLLHAVPIFGRALLRVVSLLSEHLRVSASYHWIQHDIIRLMI